jgi:lipopolysaccharide export system permease protein
VWASGADGGADEQARPEPDVRVGGQGQGMLTLRRYLSREIYGATLFVFVAFLALFAFFDLINELGDLGRGGYRLQHVLLFVVLSMPGHIYELFPIAVLIGTLYALSHLAGNSEYTVMRGSGFSTSMAAATLARIGIPFLILTFLFGELITPAAERAARQLKLQATSSVVAQEFKTGFWVKDERRFVNVREILPDTTLVGVRIFEFDRDYRLVSISDASRGEFMGQGAWRLHDITQTRFDAAGASAERMPEAEWKSMLTPNILSVLFVSPDRMSALNLYQYVTHLAENGQQTERYEIAMWKKIIYPFASLVMMALALPFAYMHVRSGTLGVKVFAGIMLGIFFHMLNSLFSHLGLLKNWSPLYSAILPSVAFLATAALMMWYVERK